MSIHTKLGFTAVSLVLALAGCSAGTHGSSTVQAERAAGGKADAVGGSDSTLFSCKVDSDCVVIEDDTSCFDGALIAVNKDHADEYCAGSTAVDCSVPAWSDTRVGQCDFQAHSCQMIDPTQIHCGGFINPSHACPDGFQCDFHGRVPDVGGSCIPTPATS